MDTLKSILADATKLRDQSLLLLEGVLDGTVAPNPGYSEEYVIECLKEDIANSRAIIKRLGGGIND